MRRTGVDGCQGYSRVASCYRRVGAALGHGSSGTRQFWARGPGRVRALRDPPAGSGSTAMGHYKSNLRDIEFNLFEVLGRERRARAPARSRDMDVDTARDDPAPRSSGWPSDELAESLRRRRPQPAGLRPGDALGHAARVVQEVATRRYMDAEWWRLDLPGRARRHRRARRRCAGRSPSWCSAPTRRCYMYCLRRRVRRRPVRRTAPTSRSRCAQLDGRPAVGRDDGAHRAGRRLRRRRRPHQGDPAGRRHLAHRGRQALHHLGRARPDREHRPPRAGPPRGRRPGHQGPVAVRRAEVPLRLARPASSASATASTSPTSSTRWASRSRPPASSPSASGEPGRRLAGRRGARRHRADVPGHRVRPDDGRHQGDRDAVDRLPQRAGVRQDPRAGRRPHRRSTDKTAPRVTITHHPDVRRC